MIRNSIVAVALLALSLLSFSCSKSAVELINGGAVVLVFDSGDDVARVGRLMVEGDKIIRVSATAEKSFADKQSLIVVDRDVDVDYKVDQAGDTVTLTTAALTAQLLTTTGELWFIDAQGDTLLREQVGGGKTFKPYEVTQTKPVRGNWDFENEEGNLETKDITYKGWTTRAMFESPADEAFFGLGQHQADEWNYKGKNEELFQYNTKVSIPFVVSSKNYGLLFDTYSLCRFGNPEDYKQLYELFVLKDKDGVEGALTGTYVNPDAELIRREDSLYFENLKSAKNLPDFPLEKAEVVYEGTITPKASGEYKFCHYYSGYQKVYIDGVDVYNEDVAGTGSSEQTIWRTAWNPNARKFNVELEEGKEYSFKLVWTPDGGEAYCGLRAYAPVDEAEQAKLSMWSEMSQQMDYYFIAGETLDEVIAGYRTLTGKAQIMPDWLLGYWQSRERYNTQREILDALQGFRDRGLPIDNIVMDWNHWKWDEWGSFTFDPERFEDPKGMIDTIHMNNAKIMISCWPKFYLTIDNFKELYDKGHIYEQSVTDSLYDWLGYKYAFVDSYDYEARKIFWRQMYENLGVLGMDAWWMDASEPNVRDCTDIDYRKLLCGPTAYGSSDEYFNAFSIVNAEAIYDGQRGFETAGYDHDTQWLQANAEWDQRGFNNDFSPENKRVFLLTRNGFASQQRYSTATWSGDIGTRWEDLKCQITAGLNFCISGVPYWSQDIGGFSVEKRYEAAQKEFNATGVENADLKDWRELNVRWHQVGMWAPMYRVHGQYPYREPWEISPDGTPTYNIIKSCLELRYRLMPYLYSLAARVHFDDYTIMRPLVMDFGKDKNVYDIGYQFMCGPAFMINPIYTYKARNREVYFPKDNIWYDFLTGKKVSDGGETKTVVAPYESIPVYVRAGSIVPFGPALEYTQQKKAEVIRVYVYQGADGTFTLYEDEGTNYGYEAGRYANIPFTYDDARGELTIGDRQGTFPGMLKEREFIIVPVSAAKPQAYDPEAKGISVKYNGAKQTVKL